VPANNYLGRLRAAISPPLNHSELHFVGTASPRSIGRALGRQNQTLESSYKQAVAFALPGLTAEEQRDQLLSSMNVLFGFQESQGKEFVTYVTSVLLRQWMGTELSTSSVEWTDDAGALLSLIRAVIRSSAPYVALLRNGDLLRVVDRAELAVRIAQDCLAGEGNLV
jgi:hypothetical protein